MKVKKVIDIVLFALKVGGLPLLFGIIEFVRWAHPEHPVDLIVVTTFVANIMCMAAGLYLIDRAGDPQR